MPSIRSTGSQTIWARGRARNMAQAPRAADAATIWGRHFRSAGQGINWLKRLGRSLRAAMFSAASTDHRRRALGLEGMLPTAGLAGWPAGLGSMLSVRESQRSPAVI